MHAQLQLDPRIRDYVFLPLVILMFSMQMLRFMVMRWMNDPKNKLLEKAKVAEVTLRDTIFAYDSNKDRMLPSEPIEMIKLLGENTEVDTQEGLALSRSKKFRSMGNWLPERSVKQRKAFYCAENTGYF